MAKVYRRKNKGREIGNWLGRYISAVGDRKHICLTSNKAESQRMLDELAAQGRIQKRRLEEQIIDISELTIADNADKLIGPVVDQYIAGMNANAASKGQERWRMNRIVRGCQIRTVGDFARSAAKFQKYLRTLPRTERSKGLAPRTIRQIHSSYSTFGRWASKVDRGFIVTNPGDSVEMPTCPAENDRVPHRAFTVAELETLCSSLNGDRDTLGRALSPKMMVDRRDRALSYRFRVFTGLRASETSKLTRASFDFDAATVTVSMLDSKTKKFEAVVPLPAGLCDQLRERFGRVTPETTLWPNHGLHTKALQRDVERTSIVAVDAAGEAINGRSFRMTHNSWCLAGGLTGIEILLLRRDSGDPATSLILRTYADKAQRLGVMRAGLDKLVAWHTAQLAQRITLAI